MDWHRVSRGPYSGKTLPEIMFQLQDPDYVLDGLEKAEFSGPLRDEAAELCRRASYVPVEPDAMVFYQVREGAYAGIAIVPKSSPEREACERSSAAATDGYFDFTVMRRLAPQDKLATLRLIQAFEYHCLGERMTMAQFFENPKNFSSTRGGADSRRAA